MWERREGWLPIGAAVVGALFAAGCAHRASPCAQEQALRSARARQEQLESEVSALQEELAAARAALASMHRAGPREGSGSDEVDESFAEEPVDEAWAPRAELTLRELLAPQLKGGTRIVRLECRSARCLLRAEHASADAKRALEHFMRARPRGFAGTVSWSNDAPGKLGSMHYFLRAGAKWPDAGASVR